MQRKELISTIISGLVIATIVFFALVFNFSYTLANNLSGFDNAIVVFESVEDNRYQLIRINRSSDRSVSYALYSEDRTLEFIFKNAFLTEVFKISEEDLFENDYVVFQITEQHRNPLIVDIYQEGIRIESRTFTYIEDYAESELLVYRHDFNHLMIRDEVLTRGDIDITLLNVFLTIVISVIVTMILYTLVIKKRNVVNRTNQDHTHEAIDTLKQKDVEEDKDIAKVIHTSALYKIKKYAFVLFINALYAIPVTLIVIAIVVWAFGSSEVDPDTALYFTAKQNNYEIDVYIGINQSIANDSDYGLDTVFYMIEFNEAFTDLYIASIQCGNQFLGRAFSDSGLAYANTTDAYYRQIDIWRREDCKNSDTFRIVVKNPNTGATVLTSSEYTLYKEASNVQNDFNLEPIEDQSIYLIGLYVFNVFATVPMIKIGIKKWNHKRNIQNKEEKHNEL